jgi:hypothetical protein
MDVRNLKNKHACDMVKYFPNLNMGKPGLNVQIAKKLVLRILIVLHTTRKEKRRAFDSRP